jgi:hypothetical protein
MSWSVRRALRVAVASLGVVIGAGVAITWAAGGPGSTGPAPGSSGVAEAAPAPAPAVGPARSRATAPRLVTTDLTPDGLDRYQYTLRPVPADPGPSTDRNPGGTADLVVTAPATNQGVNLRSVGWFDEGTLGVDAESCVTWTEYSGPIAQAGVALRVRSAPGGAQAITVTNNIMWGARNGWNVHLWSGSHGEVIGQIVLTHSFGPVQQMPPLPWRLCARVVGPALQFKAWSLALRTTEPEWTDPGYGASFALPPAWVYPGRAGWYVGHLVRGDQAGFQALEAQPLHASVGERASASSQASAQEVMRSVASGLEQALRPAAAPSS